MTILSLGFLFTNIHIFHSYEHDKHLLHTQETFEWRMLSKYMWIKIEREILRPPSTFSFIYFCTLLSFDYFCYVHNILSSFRFCQMEFHLIHFPAANAFKGAELCTLSQYPKERLHFDWKENEVNTECKL